MLPTMLQNDFFSLGCYLQPALTFVETANMFLYFSIKVFIYIFFIYNFSCTYIVYFDFCSHLTSSSRIPKIDLASAMGKSAIYSIQKRRERNELLVHDGSSSESSESDDTIVPPDGGWGWMVVLSSFMIHVIADGIVYSFGVFLMEFVVYFKSGRSAASLIGALQPAVTFTVGKW